MQTNIVTPIIPRVAVPTARVAATVPTKTPQNIATLPVITPLVTKKPLATSPLRIAIATPRKTVIPTTPTNEIPEGEKIEIIIPPFPTGKITNVVPQRVPAVAVVPTLIPTAPGPVPILPIPTAQKELTLFPWQVEWAHRAYDILLRNHGYIDTSKMRSGKSYITMWLAKQFGFRLFIICPVTAMADWQKAAAEYGVEIVFITSYQSLRSKKGHQPKGGYLFRYDNVTEGGINQVHFIPTKAYADLIEQGIMLICDEIQNIKNTSAQYKACNALIRPIITAGGRSRYGLLSGTPFDKEEHAVNLLKLIGYIRAHNLYRYYSQTKEFVLEGLQELIDACNFIDGAETQRILIEAGFIPNELGNMIPGAHVSKTQINSLCYTLYVGVIKNSISGAMATPTNITGTFDVKNGFYNINPEKGEQLRLAVDALADAVKFNRRTGTAEIRAENIGAVTTALVNIERAKIDDMARVATEILMRNKRNKVVISLNYTGKKSGILAAITNLLIYFNPLTLTGSTKNRGEVVRTFNENPEARLLIMNTAVGGVGISLYSMAPNSPRYMIMSPSYKLLELSQAAARIYGPGMLSDAIVRIFYGKGNAGLETNILAALARKTQVLKGALDDVVKRDLILPGDYKSEEEPNR